MKPAPSPRHSLAPSPTNSPAPDLILSKDGSLNGFNAKFGEHYASMGEGAFSEKLAKHIAPAWEFLRTGAMAGLESRDLRLRELEADREGLDSRRLECERSSLRVLDLCLGLGYTALLSRALSALHPPKAHTASIHTPLIHITSIEQDRAVLGLLGKIHGLDSATLAKLAAGERVQLSRQGRNLAQHASMQGISLRILWGEAREQLALLAQARHSPSVLADSSVRKSSPLEPSLLDSRTPARFSPLESKQDYAFDIIYQDPFSYEKCPALWDREHFSMLYALSKPHCLITTYATRREILLAACEAGFLAYRYKAPRHIIAELLDALGEGADREVVYRRSSSVFSKQPLGFGELRSM